MLLVSHFGENKMLEIVKKKKLVKIDGVEYLMKAPTYNDSIRYQETLNAVEHNQLFVR
jgi:hypothetical protein